MTSELYIIRIQQIYLKAQGWLWDSKDFLLSKHSNQIFNHPIYKGKVIDINEKRKWDKILNPLSQKV